MYIYIYRHIHIHIYTYIYISVYTGVHLCEMSRCHTCVEILTANMCDQTRHMCVM